MWGNGNSIKYSSNTSNRMKGGSSSENGAIDDDLYPVALKMNSTDTPTTLNLGWPTLGRFSSSALRVTHLKLIDLLLFYSVYEI